MKGSAVCDMNRFQRVADRAYPDGMVGAAAREGDGCGDTLALFLARELSAEEGCETYEDAVQRLETAEADIREVIRCLKVDRRDVGRLFPSCEDIGGERMVVLEHGKVADRYTVVYPDRPFGGIDEFHCLSLSPNCHMPNGVRVSGACAPGIGGRPVKFADLPRPCRREALAFAGREESTWICGDCAGRLGGVWPKGHVASSHEGMCSTCLLPAGVCAVDDWDWPKGSERPAGPGGGRD